jgi:hypothetical protein
MYSEGSSIISRGSREESPSIATAGLEKESGPLVPGELAKWLLESDGVPADD